MPRRFPSRIPTGCCLLLALALPALGEDTATGKQLDPFAELEPGKRGPVRFTESPIQSSDPIQVRYRLMAAETPPDYVVSRETFEVLLPPDFDPEKSHGLFLWIHSGDAPQIPRDWEAVLAKHDLIFIGARKSGNKRNIFDRVRMAIDANHNARQFLNIDGRRVYVSGFSGGSRVASMLGVAWGDMFSGTICCMGVNFYTDVEAPDGKVYGMSYLPDEQLLPLVKEACRYALVTGSKDFNLANTKGAWENGFVAEGFRHARFFEVPDHGHRPPPAEWLEKAILFLDEGKR